MAVSAQAQSGRTPPHPTDCFQTVLDPWSPTTGREGYKSGVIPYHNSLCVRVYVTRIAAVGKGRAEKEPGTLIPLALGKYMSTQRKYACSRSDKGTQG